MNSSGFVTRVELPPPPATLPREVACQGVAAPLTQSVAPSHQPSGEAAQAPGPTMFPGYVLLKELGRGGMGVVYLARQEKLQRLVAVKMIRDGRLTDAEGLDRFRAEAEIISQLRHPNIVQIYELGETQGYAYFSMELLSGGSLFHWHQQHPLAPREAAALLTTLARTMQVVHDKGILHRDLKPANILLEWSRAPEASATEAPTLAEATPKITDFGLAKRVAAPGLTQSGAILGTPEYMAPEQATGNGALLGPAVDIYALGAMLYEFLAGRPPFKGWTPMDTLLQAVTEEVVPPSRLQPKTPPDLETICLKCLQKDPARRYSTAQELAEDLQRYLDGVPTLARPAGPVERVVKWARRKPAWAALAGTVLLALLLLSLGVVLLLEANTQEAAQRQRAQENEARARAAQQLAEANFWEAKRAVDQSFRTVTEQPPFNQEHLREARMVLLEQALPFYQRFLQQRGHDPTLRHELAQTQRRIGLILHSIGSKEEARRHLQEACALLEQLAGAQPDEFPLQAELAAAWQDLGLLHQELGQYTEADTAFRAGIQRFDRLRGRQPQQKAYAEGWAQAWHQVAKLQQAQGAYDQALDSWGKAFGLWKKLAAAAPRNERYQQRLAECWITRAELFTANGAHLRAEVTYAEALQVYQTLLDRHPERTDYRAATAALHVKRGQVLSHRRNFSSRAEKANPQATREKYQQEAEQHYRQALAHYQHLNIAHPSVTEYQDHLAATGNSLGSVQHQQGKLDDAVASFHAAITTWDKLVQQQPGVLRFQSAKGAAQYNLGVVAQAQGQDTVAQARYAEAAQTLQAVLARQPQDTQARRFLAEIHVNRARTATGAGRHAEAVTEWNHVLGLVDAGESQRNYFVERALALARANDPGAAEALAEWTRRQDWKPHHYLTLARAYALLCAAITDPDHQGRLAGQARQLLQRARESGAFQGASNRENFRTHPDFAPLRSRPEFQPFLRELASPAPPPR